MSGLLSLLRFDGVHVVVIAGTGCPSIGGTVSVQLTLSCPLFETLVSSVLL
jgi:hypothetical protein